MVIPSARLKCTRSDLCNFRSAVRATDLLLPQAIHYIIETVLEEAQCFSQIEMRHSMPQGIFLSAAVYFRCNDTAPAVIIT